MNHSLTCPLCGATGDPQCFEEHGLYDPMNVFGHFQGRSGSHWGLTDMYPDHEKLLRRVLESLGGFYVNWGSKKEIAYAKVIRGEDKTVVSVYQYIDDLNDIVDTLFWLATDKQYGSGWHAAANLLGTADEDEIQMYFDSICDLLEDRYLEVFIASKNLRVSAGYEEVMSAVGELADEAAKDSEDCVNDMLVSVREVIDKRFPNRKQPNQE